jgi:hypothetical protein
MKFLLFLLILLFIQCIKGEKCLIHICFKLHEIETNCYDAFGNIYDDDYTCIQDSWGISTNCKDKIKIGTGCSNQVIGNFGDVVNVEGTKMVGYLIQQNYNTHMQKNNGTICSICYQVSFGVTCSSLIGGSFTTTAGACYKDASNQFWITDCENFIISNTNECSGNKAKIVQEINKCYYGSSSKGSGSQVFTLNTCNYKLNLNSGNNLNKKTLFIVVLIILISLSSFLLF